MVYKTKGVILHRIMHADNKMIVHAYTSDYGSKSFMLYFSLRKDKKKRNLIMAPLSIVLIHADHKNHSSIDSIKEVELIHTPSPYSFHLSKSSIILFLNEILYKILFQLDYDVALYEYIEKALIEFDQHDFLPDFHLRFLIRLTDYLGCCPNDNYAGDNVSFNCRTARFESDCSCSLEESETNLWLHILMNQDLFPENKQLIVPTNIRNSLLKLLLKYYSEHITNLSTLKSHDVLQTVLRQ
ncbi:MAG: recombination protein O N-terminal domain-containing protein [Bacteroidales bacterium]|jgi:DNA repair protein RecO (recombination protein O)|nr:recombination protein O N-terminal domain-containing protein [Bacteroidales bacterium]MDD2687138.1 recombination protein O N-terminal domain-containing protein [Bacteroidales bacterium]MDD3331121.1 recombination protein O N-terminal domain-containing protein [Bacteroidales bacterium]MDD3692171.1 recombination protein O N-terminal domain-containing protein [Bacteroidales bacterium]MDD4044214.1 recombination protein O N-terminal domain-containing protein [Bacteroidales bacterium]